MFLVVYTVSPISLPPLSVSPPHLKLDNPQGLTEEEVKELTKEIRSLARERVGEVMMLEIAQLIQVHIIMVLITHHREDCIFFTFRALKETTMCE